MAKQEAHLLCDSKQHNYCYKLYITKSSNNAMLTVLGANGIAYRVSVFSLNVSKPSHLSFSIVSTVCTIKSHFASKLTVDFQTS